MTFGITRKNGTAQTGASLNLTGTKSSFFSGYQPLFVKVQTVSATWDFTTNAALVDSEFEQLIRAAETVGSVIMYGTPANAASSSTVIVGFDAASLNQGDGVAGSGVTTGLGALKAALASAGACAASDIAITTYTGFTGAALS